MIILGLHDGHNCSAAIFRDGRLVAAIAEERLTRSKHEYGYPALAVAECLRMAGITAKDIDRAVLSTRHLPPEYYATKRNARFKVKDFWREQKEYWYPKLYKGESPDYIEVFKDKVDWNSFPYDRKFLKNSSDMEGMLEARIDHLMRTLGLSRDQIRVCDHHTSHAYFGYLASPRRDRPVLVFTMDGGGDRTNGTVSVGRPGKPLEEISRSSNCNIGRMYRYVTLLLGMRPADHEYKVMGLAAYADNAYAEEAYQVFAETLQVEGLGFAYKVAVKDHFFHFKDRLDGQRFDLVAAAIQRRCEELLLEWIRNGIKQTGIGDVILSGGVAQNIKANKRLWEEIPELTGLWVPPGPADESLSIGAGYQEALDWALSQGRDTFAVSPLEHAYIGESYSDADVCEALKNVDPQWIVRRATPDDVGALLAEGEVVARFGTDPCEFGPRALGNRSIIADPRRLDVVQVINRAIKMRDFWMPFAPSILEERAGDYLLNPKGIDARYMTVGFDSTELARKHLPAGLHQFDYSARPQLVSKSANPGYHAVISAFQKRTGVGAVLNTSFNIHGEPIVGPPAGAISTFRRCGLKHLAIGDWLVSKPE